ncbi:hypothetical protein C8R47DRAFT_1084717 [Mycena vitilis]|nr:hypothetical protein C8R47DRAFT_1084717 [Mycena vitilis]
MAQNNLSNASLAANRPRRGSGRSASTPAPDSVPANDALATNTPLPTVAEEEEAHVAAAPHGTASNAIAVDTPEIAPAVAPAAPGNVQAGTAHDPATPINVDTVENNVVDPDAAARPAAHPGAVAAVPLNDEDFPELMSPSQSPLSHAAARREKKDKGKAKAKAPAHRETSPVLEHTSLASARIDRLFDADTNRALAASRGREVDTANGASSSSHPVDPTPPSSPKRPHDDVDRADTPDPTPPRNRARYNHLTVDGNPPQGSYSPTPRGGYRAVVGVTAEWVFRNLPPAQLRQWDIIPHPKIIATIAGGNGDRMETTPRLRNHIARRFNMNPDDVLIGTPGLGEGPGPDAIPWLIAGLSLAQAQALLDVGALVSDDLTTIFHAYQPQVLGFGGTFTGLTVSPTNPDLAHAIIADAIMADRDITRFVRAHRDAIPAHISCDEALARFGESISVEAIQLLNNNKTLFTAWNVYFSSPTYDEAAAKALRALFGRLIINTPLNGQGRLFDRPIRCTICLGCDHPTNLCFLPQTPGYLGVTPETVVALLKASLEIFRPPKKNNKGGKGKFTGGKKGNDGNGGRK